VADRDGDGVSAARLNLFARTYRRLLTCRRLLVSGSTYTGSGHNNDVIAASNKASQFGVQ
jgi:hypothetical protein